MAILSRIKRILSANLISLLEKAKDPESLLNDLIREMDGGIIALRAEVTRAIASERRLARHLEATRNKVRRWDESSEKAVRDGDDGSARRALFRKLGEERRFAEYNEQHARAKQLYLLLESQLYLLEEKVKDARRKKEVQIGRKRNAETRKAMFAANRDFAVAARKSDELLSGSGLAASVPHQSLEDQVRDLEWEADAMDALTTGKPDLEEVFEKSKADEEVERQLVGLKKRLKKAS
jgi:phage shock protein A